MARDLTTAKEDNNRRVGVGGGPPQASLSYSSTLANPSVSPDYSRNGSPVPSDRATAGQLTTDISNLSLSVNYLPSKFSSGVLVGGGGGPGETRVRRPPKHDSAGSFFGVPKMGGGVDVFRSGEARMGDGNEDDEDDDDDEGEEGVGGGGGGGGGAFRRFSWFVHGRKRSSQPLKRKLRWNKFKWILFIANAVVSSFSLLFRLCLLHRWFLFSFSFVFLVDHILIHRTYILSPDVV